MVIKNILKKLIVRSRVISFFDSGERLDETTIQLDTFAQIIDGNAEIIINGTSNFLETGQSIVIPAHVSNYVKPNGCFKMLLTIIKVR